MEPLEQRHLLSVVTISADDLAGKASNDGLADEFRLVRNGGNLEVLIDGTLSQSLDLATLTGVVVQGSSDVDTLIVDLSGGIFSLPAGIQFDGEALGANVSSGDTLVLTGDPGTAINRISYGSGPRLGLGPNDGGILIDPDDSTGVGGGFPTLSGANGDEVLIQFFNLSPVIDTVPAAQLDVFATNAAETISIIDGPISGGDQTATISAATFEDYSFANKTRVTVNALDGADTFVLNYSVQVPGLDLLDLYGNELTGGTLESDDAAGETFQILATGPGTTANRMYGQNGGELFSNSATKYLDPIQSNVQMHGQSGNSIIDLSDINDPTGDVITIEGNKIVGAATGAIEVFFATIEDVRFEATSGDDVITVLSTFAPFKYRISGGPGSDVFRVGSYDQDPSPAVSLAWAPYAAGSNTIGQIKGELTIVPGPTGDTGVDDLYVDDSGGLAGYLIAQIDDAAGGSVLARTTTLLNFDAAAPIKYEYTPGVSELENLFIHTSQASDHLVVNATTAQATQIDLGPGNDDSTLIIAGDYLSGANVFLGNSGADRFVLNMVNDLGAWSALPLTQLRIQGDDPAGTVGGDALFVNDFAGVARNIDFGYSGSGDVLVTGFAVPVDVRSVEVVDFSGDAANDDVISVTGTPADDLITVAPLSGDSARVFLGGDPWDGPAADGDFFDQFPGVAGGGAGPDLHISGAANLDVDAAGGTSNRLYIYAPSEDDLTDGVHVVVPGLGSGNAFDQISVTDSAVTVTNNSAGTLLPISFNSSVLVQAVPTDRGLVVNSGFEAAPDAGGLADNVDATPSNLFAMMVNGGDPVPAFAPDGDHLQILGWGDVDVWADKDGTVSLSVSGLGTFPVDFSSIENLAVWVGGTVNLYGDNNDPGVDQNDLFEIVGTGYQSFRLSINGNAPIEFFGVTDLNIYGDDAAGTPSSGPNDVDTLMVTPYADNSPQGWGINIFFNEGNPADGTGAVPDPIIYNGVAGVSERIELVPTGPGNGQLRVTNSADGSLITVINYVANTGFIINGNDGSTGDTDTLIISGTDDADAFVVQDADTVDVTGIFTVDFSNFSLVTLRGQAGLDSFTVNPGNPQVVIDGGVPEGNLQSNGDLLSVVTGGASFSLTLGPEGDQGTFTVSGQNPISFDHLEALEVDGVLYTLPDLQEPNDSLAGASILGSIPHLTIRDLSIHTTQVGTTNDDYFQVTARDTGALLVNVLFDRDAVPGNLTLGELGLEVLDGAGNVVATGAATALGFQVAIPVVSQERYYLRVFSTDNDPNTYTLEIENFAAPTPTAIGLHPAYDTGRDGADAITNADDPVLLIQAWLSDFAAKGISVLTAAQAAAGTPGVAVEVFINGVSAGFADPFGPSNNVFAFALPAGLLSVGLPGGYPGYPTAHGWMNFISAAVRVLDPQVVQVTGARELGTPAVVTYDPNLPDAAAITLNLNPASDSATLGDGITNVSSPTFGGLAEANAIVRLYANNQLVGQAVAGSDLSDGVAGNGLGAWSIVSQPLTDGAYTFAVTAEDRAGNVTDIAFSPTVALTIDATPPQIPTIDLQDADDTGRSDLDNVTIGDPTQAPGFVDFGVTGEVGTTAVIKDGEVVLDTFVFAAPFEIRTLALAEGAHPLTIEVTDAAGNFRQSEQLLLTVDYTAPVPATIALAPYSDSGTPGDGITNVAAPAFYGHAEANALVRLYVDDGGGPVLAGWTFAHSDESDGDPTDGLGVWEITVEPLADGDYTVWVEVEDLAGNISGPSGDVAISIDTSLPQIPTIDLQDADDTGRFDLDNVTIGDPTQSPGIVDVRISAEPGSTVYIKDGNTIVDVFVFDAAFDLSDGLADGFGVRTIDFNLNEVVYNIPAEGPHPLTVESIDAAGNARQSEQLLVTVDFTAPSASAPSLADYADSGVIGDGITGVMPPAFVGTAEANAWVRLYVDRGFGAELAGETRVNADESDGDATDGLGVWEITIEPLADGVYTVWVEIEDLAGNISDAVENLQLAIEITVDTTPPQIPTIDLQDLDDTGWADKDNVTIGDPTQVPGVADFRISAELGTTVLVKDGEVVIDTFVFDNAFDLTDGLADGFGILTIDFNLNEIFYNIPAEGPHPLTVEAIDAAANFRQSEQLLVTVDYTAPFTPSTPDLLPSSDSGAFDNDDVTRINAPAFQGFGEANTLVRIWAEDSLGQVRLVGQATVGSDESDGIPTDGFGIWGVTIEPLDDGVYQIYAELEDQAGNLSAWSQALTIEIDTYEPNTPYLDLVTSDDTGRSNVDNVTQDNTPIFTAATSDPNALIHLFGGNLRYRIYDRTEGSGDVLIYDSGALLNANSINTGPLGPLVDGVHNLKLEVEDRAGNISHDFLLTVVVDTVIPSASFGELAIANDGLHPDSDSGVAALPVTSADRITNDTTPTLWGRAEADAVVRLYADTNANGAVDAGDVFLGQTTATPLDGNQAEPNGYWEITSAVDLNDPAYFARDGVRRLLAQATDPAGNNSVTQQLNIWIDTQGPRVESVFITSAPGFNLFNPKPTDGPTPLVNQLSIRVADLPQRAAGWLYEALARDGGQPELAIDPGHFSLVGDANGAIPIAGVTFLSDAVVAGQPARGTIVLTFAEPLPDDRFTLTVSDDLRDPAGNRLDGESNAVEPQDPPLFPTGDGLPGGSFSARFTVDSRPEVGVWAAGSVWIDTNGNSVFDPDNLDYTNRDIIYALGLTSDDVFAGNFAQAAGDTTDGFDKLAAYGRVNGSFRWLVDTDNDGVPNVNLIEPAAVNGLPFAGRFDDSDANGDEVGVVTAFPPAGQPSYWYFDTNHDFQVDYTLTSELRGYPVVGDFDSDGFDDLATWRDDTFYVDLANGARRGWDGVVDVQFRFGFIGTQERPVAADMDQDGFDDLGLWVPNRSGQTPGEAGEWYFLVSGGDSLLNRIVVDPIKGWNMIEFTPTPFGSDIYQQFGDEFALPVVGNFDPPVVPRTSETGVTLNGTGNDDVVEISAGDTAANWTITINGETQVLDGSLTALTVNLGGGNDQVVFTGTSGDDVIELQPGTFVFSGTGYSITVLGGEVLSANAGSGNDSVVIHDGSGDDVFTVWPGLATLQGPGYRFVVEGAEDVRAIADQGGADVAMLYDSPGDDVAEIAPGAVVLSGQGFRSAAEGFEFAHAVAKNGGTDVARFAGSAGTDEFVARPDYSTMLSGGLFARAKGFSAVEIVAPDGNQSWIKMVDGDGDDTFTGSPTGSTLQGPGYEISVLGVAYVHAYARAGGNDTAVLTGSDGDDRLVIDDRFAKLFGDGYFLRVKYFETVTVDTLDGNDTAKVLDTPGDDVFTGGPNRFALQTRKQVFEGRGLETIQALATRGGQDSAYLYDSTGNDVFTGTPTRASLTGSAFNLQVSAFDYVYAYSTGGRDVARLTGSSGNDSYVGDRVYGKLSGSGFFLRTKNFAEVYVASGGGADTGRITGSASDDAVFADGVDFVLQNLDFVQSLNGFRNVQVKGSGGTDTAEVWNGLIRHDILPLDGGSAPTDPNAVTAVFQQFSQIRVRSNQPGGNQDLDNVDDITFQW
ncbi:MAG: hypothetical protein Kow0040_10920 [Thermogutta sp.]